MADEGESEPPTGDDEQSGGRGPTDIEGAQIIASEMDHEMQQYAVQVAKEAIQSHPNEKMMISQQLMTSFEQKYGPPWHCIVSDGQLGFYVRYDPKHHIYFAVGPITIFLFKSMC